MPLTRPFAATPGNLWRPRFKPNPFYTAELDPNGSLSAGLQTLILFQNVLSSGAIQDLVHPYNKFTINGSSATQTVSPYGGGALNFNGSSIDTDYLALGTPIASTATWTASWFSKFTGSATGVGVDAIIVTTGGWNSATGLGIDVNNSNGQYQNIQGTLTFTPSLTTITGWHRHTFTHDGTTCTFYQDGIQQSTASGAITFALAWIMDGWEFPTADFFFWNRRLTTAQVQSHAADPYGTTMRPKMDEWTIKGTAAVGTVKKQGLLTTGVGP